MSNVKRGRATSSQIAMRKLFLLKHILAKGEVALEDLEDVCRDNRFPDRDLRTLKRDLFDLIEMGMPLRLTDKNVTSVVTGPEDSWKHSRVGYHWDREKKSSIEIARRVVDFIKSEAISALILGTGMPPFAVAREIFDNSKELPIRHIYTNNLLVLEEYTKRAQAGIRLFIPPGEVDLQNGSVIGLSAVEYLDQAYVDAVVTSFDGISIESGANAFWSDDISERHLNRKPHPTCKYTIIIVSWENIVRCEHFAVGTLRELTKKWSGNQKCVVFTNPPSETIVDTDKRMSDALGKINEIEKVTVVLEGME